MILACPERFELPTYHLEGGYSIQLSYGQSVIKLALFARNFGGTEGTRTRK